MVQIMSQGLDDHLNEMNVRFQTLNLPKATSHSVASGHSHRVDDEYENTNKCLSICAQIFSYIEELQLQRLPKVEHRPDGVPVCVSSDDFTHTSVMTLSTLQKCADLLSNLRHLLHAHREQGHDLLQAEGTLPPPQKQRGSTEDVSAKLYPSSSSDDRRATPGGVHLENITIGNGGQQILVSTLGQVFTARHIVVGDRSTQFIGSCSDASFQQYLGSL